VGEPRTTIGCPLIVRTGHRRFCLSAVDWSSAISTAVSTQSTARLQRSLEDACHIAKICEEYRGKDTVVLDLTRVTPIMDFFVITSGSNVRQLHALSDEVRVQMKARGHKAPATEGYEQSSWILQDWGDIVLHSFLPEARELYDLEGLWADARRIDWQAVVEKTK
jgi:ribosome-associated protein